MGPPGSRVSRGGDTSARGQRSDGVAIVSRDECKNKL